MKDYKINYVFGCVDSGKTDKLMRVYEEERKAFFFSLTDRSEPGSWISAKSGKKAKGYRVQTIEEIISYIYQMRIQKANPVILVDNVHKGYRHELAKLIALADCYKFDLIVAGREFDENGKEYDIHSFFLQVDIIGVERILLSTYCKYCEEIAVYTSKGLPVCEDHFIEN